MKSDLDVVYLDTAKVIVNELGIIVEDTLFYYFDSGGEFVLAIKEPRSGILKGAIPAPTGSELLSILPQGLIAGKYSWILYRDYDREDDKVIYRIDLEEFTHKGDAITGVSDENLAEACVKFMELVKNYFDSEYYYERIKIANNQRCLS